MKNKKQHYLPQCYLRNFADGNLIWTYNKKLSKSYQQNISSAGQKSNFYKMSEKYLGEDDEKRDPNYIEKEFFANFIEPKFSKILQTIKTKHTLWTNSHDSSAVLSDEERMEFAALLGIQFLRLPYIQQKYWKWYTDTADARTAIIKAFIKTQHEFDPDLVDNFKIQCDEDGKTIIHSSLYADQELVDQYQDAILNKYWLFRVADQPVLYTSDFPMIVRPHVLGQPYLLEGFNTHGAEIIFPLSASLLLTLCDPVYFKDQAGLDNTFTPIPAKSLREYNIYQYSFATSDVYTLTNDFKLIDQLVASNDGKEFFASPPGIKVY